jgi:hypothetical protein
MSEGGMSLFSELKQLQVLELDYCQYFTDDGMRHLKGLCRV